MTSAFGSTCTRPASYPPKLLFLPQFSLRPGVTGSRDPGDPGRSYVLRRYHRPTYPRFHGDTDLRLWSGPTRVVLYLRPAGSEIPFLVRQIPSATHERPARLVILPKRSISRMPAAEEPSCRQSSGSPVVVEGEPGFFFPVSSRLCRLSRRDG